MKYRIAKRCDLDHIVDLHLKVREVYDIGFFSKMGRHGKLPFPVRVDCLQCAKHIRPSVVLWFA